jgi:hypothetical protein
MPDSVDSPAPLKMATLPIRKASTNIPNDFALLSIATAFYQLTRRHGNSLPKITLKAKFQWRAKRGPLSDRLATVTA